MRKTHRGDMEATESNNDRAPAEAAGGRSAGRRDSLSESLGVDTMHQFQTPPGDFGVLCPWIADRVVAFKQVPKLADSASVHEALVALHTLAAAYQSRPSRAQPEWYSRLRYSARPPAVVLFSHRLDNQPPVTLRQQAPGLWTTENEVGRAMLVVIEAERLAEGSGTGLLRWMALPESPDEAEAHVEALLNDPTLSHSTLDRLAQGLLDGSLPGHLEEAEAILAHLDRPAENGAT